MLSMNTPLVGSDFILQVIDDRCLWHFAKIYLKIWLSKTIYHSCLIIYQQIIAILNYGGCNIIFDAQSGDPNWTNQHSDNTVGIQ